jgi:glycosyltransferase involved in cell wall biosynthesis
MIVDTYSTWNFYYAYLTAFFGKQFNIPYIPILHGGNLPQRLDKNKTICKYIFQGSFKNVTPSTYLKEEFEKRGYQSELIENNIELEKYEFRLRENIEPKLLYVRSFAKIYNTKMAIRAFEIVKKRYPDAKLTMVGPDRDGSLEETKAFTKELGLESDVTFTGGLSKEEWIDLSKGFDIFINPTNFDNLPVSIVEAMALGFVIVSTNVGGLSYLIENEKDGLLVDKNDHIAMANKIIRALKEPDLCSKLSSNARKKAKGYAWSEVKKKWDKVIREAINDA